MIDAKKVIEWSKRIHEWAVGKGWWDGGVESRDIAEVVANFHSEVSEAWEEYRAGRMELWYSQSIEKERYPRSGDSRKITVPGKQNIGHGMAGKPEGFWVEIADLCIRLMDAMAAYQPAIVAYRSVGYEYPTIALFVCQLHLHVCCWRSIQVDHSHDILVTCFTMAEKHGVDLWNLIELKHAYNETRSHRHGGKLA